MECLIEQNKERYYETLEQGSRGWHEGKHGPRPLKEGIKGGNLSPSMKKGTLHLSLQEVNTNDGK